MGTSTKEGMATTIHNTTLTMTNIEMDNNNWELEETLSNIGFPMYFAFDRTGNLAVIGFPFCTVPTDTHQAILHDVKRQLVSDGFDFFAFGTQDCIYAVENTGNKHWKEHTEKEVVSGKRMLMTQICDIEGNDVALCTDFKGQEGGFIKDNESVTGSEPHHIIWASATDCHVTYQDLNTAVSH